MMHTRHTRGEHS